jgi:macrodomain Ter protein organizer (MatP/YcbG family)
VLREIGKLCATKGGAEARKASGTNFEFSNAERTWLDEAMNEVLSARSVETLNAKRKRMFWKD